MKSKLNMFLLNKNLLTIEDEKRIISGYAEDTQQEKIFCITGYVGGDRETGGEDCCSCGCYYAKSGGSSSSDNYSANHANCLHSVPPQ